MNQISDFGKCPAENVNLPEAVFGSRSNGMTIPILQFMNVKNGKLNGQS